MHAELATVSALHGLQIHEIRDNNPNVTKLDLKGVLSVTAWKLLGRYIANNTHLEYLQLSGIGLSDETIVVSSLFRGLTKSSSIEVLKFDNSRSLNNFSADGVRSMIPFLQNSPQLKVIDFSGNNNVDTAVFEVLVNALDGGSINELTLNRCSITDISSLGGNVTLPCIKKISLYNNNIQNIGGDMSSYTTLESLNLDINRIGVDGCQALAHLLQKEDSNLTYLRLEHNGIGDEGIEVLANSLKHNKKLINLYLKGNNLKEKGYQALLKLLMDVSSIENTYNSNHTIANLDLERSTGSDETIIKRMKEYIKLAINANWNRRSFNPGRFKVIDAQLNSKKRTELCEIQGIEYSYESIFSEVDALVLPEVLALIGSIHGTTPLVQRNQKQTELFRMLVTVASDLSSIVNRPAFIRQKIEDNEEQVVALGIKYEREVAALKTKKLELKRELESLQSRETTKDKEVGDEKLSGKKRDRS